MQRRMPGESAKMVAVEGAAQIPEDNRRQAETQRSKCTGHGYVAAMLLDDPFHQSKADAGALHPARKVTASAVEAVEDALLLIRGDATFQVGD